MTQPGVVFYPLDSRHPSRKPGSAHLSVHPAAQAVFCSRKVRVASEDAEERVSPALPLKVLITP